MNLYFNKPGKTRLEPSQSLINFVPSFILDDGDEDECSESDDENSDSSSEENIIRFEDEKVDQIEHEFLVSLSRENRDLAGPWDSHRFENKAWIPPVEKDSNFQIQPKENAEGESLKKTLPADPVELTKEMIAEGLSYLERSPETFQYAYTKCVLARKGIFCLELLKTYKFIQYLDISGNKLNSLTPLENLIYLKHLDASYNNLDTLLDFKPPFFLTTVNLSHNRIGYLRDLSDFWSLVELNLSHNYIKEICGLLSLRYLNTLNLSHNEIKEIEELEGLRIQYLYLQNNAIKYDLTANTKEPKLDSLPHLRFVNLSSNEIKSLKMFESVTNLEILEVANNGVKELLDVYYLRNLQYLTRLNLENNPVTKLRRYVEVCVASLKNLVLLDNQKIQFEFWQEKMSQKMNENDVVQLAYKQRLKLLILEQMNEPVIWDWIKPYDIPPLGVIMLVGPKGSQRTKLMKSLCNLYEGVILGVLHTTRPRHEHEIDGKDFYYISHEKFMTMLKNGEFVTFYETLGNYFGIAHREFDKSVKSGVVVFRGDLLSGLALKSKFFNAKLVLSVSSTKDDHIKTLANFYSYTIDKDTIRIVRSPDRASEQRIEEGKLIRDLVEKDVSEILNNIINKICLANSEQFLSKLKTVYKNASSEHDSQALFKMWVQGDSAIVEIPEMLASLQEVFFTSEAWRELSTILSVPDELRQLHLESVISEEKANMSKKNVSFMFGSSTERNTKNSDVKQYILKCLKYLRDSSNLDQAPEDLEVMSTQSTMQKIFDYFLKNRTQLLELHFAMPGLFRELVFPDKEEESMEKLIRLAKDTFQLGQKYLKPILDMKGDEQFEKITQSRIEQCLRDISCEMSVAEKQMNEFLENLDLDHAADCTDEQCRANREACAHF